MAVLTLDHDGDEYKRVTTFSNRLAISSDVGAGKLMNVNLYLSLNIRPEKRVARVGMLSHSFAALCDL